MSSKRVILSVSDKSGIVDFARGLKGLGWDILSTGGTAKVLRENDIEVKDIAEYTSSPEILEGRLKTLHPMIHGGILGVRDSEKHAHEMQENNILPIDMVVVNLYPFQKTVANSECSLEDAIENIDIGGPTMIRAAAKNYKYVTVVVDPEDYTWILDELKNSDLSVDKKFVLAKKVYAHTAKYDTAISNYLGAVIDGCKKDVLPETIGFVCDKAQDLRYGENPHMKAAFYKEENVSEPCIANAKQIHGKEMSYNNIMDADAAIEIVKEFMDGNFVAILKHTNPCGAAISDKSLSDAFLKAKESDPVSAFGGIVGVNKMLDEETALLIKETFFEVIIAPSFSENAKRVLMKKKNIRLLEIPGLGKDFTGSGYNTRKVVGGLLVQDRDLKMINVSDAKVVTDRSPSIEEQKGLSFAWKICKHVKSNAIVYTSDSQILGVGAGQMSRVDSAQIARVKMEQMMERGVKPNLIVCASDAFFPFRDGIDAASKAGATAIIQPGGSVKDSETIEAANEHNIAMLFTGTRHFKH